MKRWDFEEPKVTKLVVNSPSDFALTSDLQTFGDCLDVTGPMKSERSGVIEMLSPESQMMGLVFAFGPRDSHIRARA